MDVLARPWNGLIIATLGEHGALRFSALRAKLSSMGDRMLSARLKDLEARGLVARTVAPGPPVRVDYRLTELGEGFQDVAAAIGRWGARFAPPPGRGGTPAARPAKAARRTGTRKAG